MQNLLTEVTEFLESQRRAGWIVLDGVSVYLRRGYHNTGDNVGSRTFDIANVTVTDKEQGKFTTLLTHCEKLGANEGLAVYIENVQTQRFADFFIKRGYVQLGKFSPCFYRAPKERQ